MRYGGCWREYLDSCFCWVEGEEGCHERTKEIRLKVRRPDKPYHNMLFQAKASTINVDVILHDESMILDYLWSVDILDYRSPSFRSTVPAKYVKRCLRFSGEGRATLGAVHTGKYKVP